MPGRDQLQIGAHVGQQLDAHRGDPPIGVGRHLDVLDLAATLDGGVGVLGPLLDPAHRLAQPTGQRQGEGLLGIDVELASEASADRRCHDP